MGVLDKLRQIFKRSASMQSDANRFEAMQSEPNIEIEKDSLQLGIAAGFTGRSLRNIEDSLTRIEAQMVTKDWMTLTVKGDIEQHLAEIKTSLDSITGVAASLPEEARQQIMGQVSKIRAQLQPTSRMIEMLSIIKETKEISYEDLASKLGISVSSLRGLLSMAAYRMPNIERFERKNKGWVRYKQPITAMQSDQDQPKALDELQK